MTEEAKERISNEDQVTNINATIALKSENGRLLNPMEIYPQFQQGEQEAQFQQGEQVPLFPFQQAEQQFQQGEQEAQFQQGEQVPLFPFQQAEQQFQQGEQEAQFQQGEQAALFPFQQDEQEFQVMDLNTVPYPQAELPHLVVQPPGEHLARPHLFPAI